VIGKPRSKSQRVFGDPESQPGNRELKAIDKSSKIEIVSSDLFSGLFLRKRDGATAPGSAPRVHALLRVYYDFMRARLALPPGAVSLVPWKCRIASEAGDNRHQLLSKRLSADRPMVRLCMESEGVHKSLMALSVRPQRGCKRNLPD
jgi:hypothetical protein